MFQSKYLKDLAPIAGDMPTLETVIAAQHAMDARIMKYSSFTHLHSLYYHASTIPVHMKHSVVYSQCSSSRWKGIVWELPALLPHSRKFCSDVTDICMVDLRLLFVCGSAAVWNKQQIPFMMREFLRGLNEICKFYYYTFTSTRRIPAINQIMLDSLCGLKARIFNAKIWRKKNYLRNGRVHWHGMKGMWIDRILDPLCELELWPWTWIFKVKFWSSCIGGMGGLTDMEWKWCESIGCWTSYVIMNYVLDLACSRPNIEIAMSQDWIDVEWEECQSISLPLCDLKLGPHPWPWAWIFKVKFGNTWKSGRLMWNERDVSRYGT